MANPLTKHFRQPAIYLALPSRGRFYPDDGIELTATGTIPVYPMTVKDELALKTPDGLLNGQAVIDVIKSCCPAIRDPWEMPAVDLDPIFIAMRLASYGKGMDFNTKCPHCKETSEYAIDLNKILDTLSTADYSKLFVLDGLSIKFKPQKYKNMNRISMINFEQDKLIQNVINNETLSEEEKMTQFKVSFERIRQLNIDLVIDSIDSITTKQGEMVNDRGMIEEYLNNCSRQVYEDIKKAIEELVDAYKIKPLELTCSSDECGKPFTTTLTFDQSNFFE